MAKTKGCIAASQRVVWAAYAGCEELSKRHRWVTVLPIRSSLSVYLLRAYEVNQYDALLCLNLAQAYFGRSTNRQSDNRNYQIAQASAALSFNWSRIDGQGMAFLTRYRKLSPRHAEAQDEVEYNYGRSFHSIGVLHLAVVHYERVLDSVQKRMDAVEDEEVRNGCPALVVPIDVQTREEIRRRSVAWESAHNLMQVYAASGSMELVKARSKWMAI